MSRITVTTTHDGTDHCFDDSELHATYNAELTPGGDVVVTIDLYRGPELLTSVPAEQFSAAEVDGFSEA